MTRPIDSMPLAHPNMSDPTLSQRIADRLRGRMHAQRVVVYGSVARGDPFVRDILAEGVEL